MNKSDIVFLKACTFLVLEYSDFKDEDTAGLLTFATRQNDKIKISDKPRMIDQIQKLSRIIIKNMKVDN